MLRTLSARLAVPQCRCAVAASSSLARGFKSRSLRPQSDPQATPGKLERVPEITGYYVIGSGDHGQLGVADVDLAMAPKKIDTLDAEPVQRVRVGHNHSVAVLRDGRALAWGYNALGQLGVGHREPVRVPTALVGLEGHAVRDAVPGPLQTWLLTENLRTGKQALWHCGSAYADSRPDARDHFTSASATPHKVKKRDYLGAVKVTKVVPAADFCLLLTEEQRVYSLGNGLGVGALGLGEFRGDEADITAGPTIVSALQRVPIVEACVGWGHALALSAEGELFAWGANAHGQCGLDLASAAVLEPRRVRGPLAQRRLVGVACGETHSLALDDQGSVWAWGSAAEGKLGLGAEVTRDVLAPEPLHVLDGEGVVAVAAGVDHSAALTRDGRIFVWGFGQHGALSSLSELRNAWAPLVLPPAKFFAGDQSDRPDARSLPVEYPFIVDGVKVSEAEYFDTCYAHVPVSVQCGMDLTLMTLRSTLKPEYRNQ